MSNSDGDYEFFNFREKQPICEGLYVWRLPHKIKKDLTLIFLTNYRERNAGYDTVLSPEFEYWDGFNLILPEGPIEWAEYDGEDPKPGGELLEIVGVKNDPCPFCKKIPQWKCYYPCVAATPIIAKSFSLKCCQFANTVFMEDPALLSETRNALLRYEPKGEEK